MNDILSILSGQLSHAVEAISPSIVQLHGRRRQVAGVVFDSDLVVAPASALDQEVVSVRRPDGRTSEGTVLGHASSAGIGVVRVSDLGLAPVRPGDEPHPGALTLAVGRTWSGNVFSLLAPVAVVGGPLRTGRSSEIERVIRVGIAPHGALVGGALVAGGGAFVGLLTSASIRGTTVAIPASIALPAAREIVQRGTERRGFIGVTSLPVALTPRQRPGGRERGLLVTGVSPEGPAEAAGVLVGDVIIAFDGSTVVDSDELLQLLRGERVGRSAELSVVRGERVEALSVTVQERRRV